MKYFLLFLFTNMLIVSSYAYEPVPVGTTIINYGIYDSDGNITHELAVGQKYEIRAHFKSDMEESVPFTYFIQIIDKDKHWTEPVDEFRTDGILQPHEEKSFAFEWVPEYEGRFRTFSEVGNTASQTTIGGVPQYDFVVIKHSSSPEANYVDFRDTEGKIICKGYSSAGGFFEYPECGPPDQFIIRVLVVVLPVVGIVTGFVVWRVRK